MPLPLTAPCLGSIFSCADLLALWTTLTRICKANCGQTTYGTPRARKRAGQDGHCSTNVACLPLRCLHLVESLSRIPRTTALYSAYAFLHTTPAFYLPTASPPDCPHVVNSKTV